MKIDLKLKNDSIEVAGIKKDYKEAIMEYIWNGFDANATEIGIDYKVNELGGITELNIIDNGDGIEFENIENTFGTFLSSEKKSKKNICDDIHGSKGKGRFSFISFANFCKWNTIYKNNEQLFEYTINIEHTNKNQVEYSKKEEVINTNTQTEVIISGIEGLFKEDLEGKDFEECLLNNFAWFLYLNKEKNFKIKVKKLELEYDKYIDETLSQNYKLKIEQYDFEVFFIKWKKQLKSKYFFHMIDENYLQKHKVFTSYNNNGIGFIHSVYVYSKYFNDFIVLKDDEYRNQTIITKEKTDNDKVFKEVVKKLNEILVAKCKEFLRKNSEKIIYDMEEENVFPNFSENKYDKIRKQDLFKVVQEVYCIQPRIFKKANIEQKKTIVGFLNLLLDSNERNNIITIMENITNLTQEERTNLAVLLEKTTLSNIIKTLKLLDDRDEIVKDLKTIVFEGQRSANERDHIQKIMEKNFWLFGEQYHLVTADKHFEQALKKYKEDFYCNEEQEESKIENSEKNRRMDIFICANRPLDNYINSSITEENIILELKAPSVKIDKTIFRQIEDYMELIRTEPQFNSTNRIWKFYAISNEIDDFVKGKYLENKNKGLPLLVKELENYQIFVMTWDDVFKNFECKYRYLYERLNFNKSLIEKDLDLENYDRKKVNELTDKILEKDVVNI